MPYRQPYYGGYTRDGVDFRYTQPQQQGFDWSQVLSNIGGLSDRFSSMYPGGAGGGNAANAYRQAGGAARGFYENQLGQSDPLGTIGNLANYAQQRFGQASRGIRGQQAEGLRQFDESYGGLKAGGVNPNARGFSRLLSSAGTAGALGNTWSNLQNAEQQMRQQALESTGAYRKGIADSLSGYARDIAGATGTDQQTRLGEMGIQANLLSQDQQNFLAMILPFLQYGQLNSYRPGFTSQDFQGLLGSLGAL